MRQPRLRAGVVASLLSLLAGAAPARDDTALRRVREAIEAREARIAATGASLELLDLLAAQVEDHLRVLHLGGTDLALLYGMTDETMREQVREHASAVVTLTERAAALGEEVIEASAREAAFGQEADAEGERRRQRAIHTVEVQMPLRRARAEVLLGFAASRTEARASHAQRAGDALAGMEAVSDWSDASALLLKGLAARLAGREDRGVEACRAAGAIVTRADDDVLLESVGAECALAEALAWSDRGDPTRARQALEAVRGEAPFVNDHGLNLFWQLALADAWLRIGFTEASRLAEGPLRTAAYARGLARHEELAAGGDATRRDLIARRVMRACATEMPYQELPALAPYAWALRRLEMEGATAEVRGLLASVADREGAAAVWRADAAARLHGLLIREHAPDDALARLLQAARLEPDPVASQRLLANALADVLRPHDDDAPSPALVIEVLREVDASDMAHDAADQWRVHLAALLVRRYVTGEAGSGRADVLEAIAVLGRVAGDGEHAEPAATAVARAWRDALQVAEGRWAGAVAEGERFEVAFAAERLLETAVTETSRPWRLEALVGLGRHEEALAELSEFPPRSDSLLPAAWRAAWGAGRLEWLPRVATRLDEPSDAALAREMSEDVWSKVQPRTSWLLDGATPQAGDEALVETMRLLATYCDTHWRDARLVQRDRLAWGLLVAGHAEEAKASFQALIDEHGTRRPWLLGLGEASYRAGDAEASFATFRQLAQAAEAAEAREAEYWHAWVRMLEILEARGGQEDRIRREVERLGWLDTAAAHERYLARARELVK